MGVAAAVVVMNAVVIVVVVFFIVVVVVVVVEAWRGSDAPREAFCVYEVSICSFMSVDRRQQWRTTSEKYILDAK